MRVAAILVALACLAGCGPLSVLPPAEVVGPRKKPTGPPLEPGKGVTVLSHEPVPYGEKLIEPPKPEPPPDDGGLRELGVTTAATSRPDVPPVPDAGDLVALAPPSPPAHDATPAERGEYLFALHCVTCHGAGGGGDGPSADALLYPPSDLTRIAERRGGVFVGADIAAHLDGRVAHPSHGPPEGPVWGPVFAPNSERAADLADLLVFLEALQQPGLETTDES